MHRRDFLKAGMGAAVAFRAAQAMPGNKFRWACTSVMFEPWRASPIPRSNGFQTTASRGVEGSMRLERSLQRRERTEAAMDKYSRAWRTWGDGNTTIRATRKVRATVEYNTGWRATTLPSAAAILKVNLTMRDMKAHPIPNWWTTEQLGVLAKRSMRSAGARWTPA